MLALNFVLEGEQQFSSDKGHFFEDNFNFYWNFAKGTAEQGIIAIAMGVVGYFKTCDLHIQNKSHTGSVDEIDNM